MSHIYDVLKESYERNRKELSNIEERISALREELHDAVMRRADINRWIAEEAAEMSRHKAAAEPQRAPRRWTTDVAVTAADIHNAAGGKLPSWKGALRETTPAPAPSQQHMAAADSLYGVLEEPEKQARIEAAAEIQAERARKSVEAERRVLAQLAGDPVEAILAKDEAEGPIDGYAAYERVTIERTGDDWKVGVPELIDPATGKPADAARAGVLRAHAEAAEAIGKIEDPAFRAQMQATLDTAMAGANLMEATFQALHGDKVRAQLPEPTTDPTRDAGDAAEAIAVQSLDLRTLAGRPMSITMMEPPQRESAVARTVRKWLGRA